MKYRISIKAKGDMENIWLNTVDKWSFGQADNYIDELISLIERITRKQFLGKSFHHIRPGYFKFPFKSHFIFYKINKTEEYVEIIRILHQRMDIENRLSE